MCHRAVGTVGTVVTRCHGQSASIPVTVRSR